MTSKGSLLGHFLGLVSSTPPLKDPDDNWVLRAEDKADLFVDAFSKKIWVERR